MRTENFIRALALTLVSSLALTARTEALTPDQREAIEHLVAAQPSASAASAIMARHYAVLLWVEDYCNGRSAESVRNYLLEKGTADRDAFEVGWMDTFSMLGKTEPKAMCALALEQYGPEGAQIKGAWAPRK